MAVATGVTLSASLAGIVQTIRLKSFTYMGQNTPLKSTVHAVGVGSKGNSVTEPEWDPTARSVTAGLTEGERFTAYTAYKSATRTYTATEDGHGTILTKNDVEDASESVMDAHAEMHGFVHAKQLESKIAAVCASFTGGTAVTATSATTGMTINDIAKAKAYLSSQAQAFRPPYYLPINGAMEYNLFKGLTQVSNVGVLGSLGDRTLEKYTLGTLLGDVNVVLSNLGITGTASQTAYTTGLYCKDAIGLFMPRPFELDTQKDIDLRGTKLLSTHRSGARVRQPKGGVKITARGTVV